MTIRNRTISVVIALLLAAVPGGAVAQGDGADADRDGAESDQASGGPAPYGVCIDGVCYVTDEPIDVDPGAVDGVSDVIYTADADAPGRIVCLEGDGECTVVDPSSSVDDLAASSNGRLVHGAIDADPSGTWRTTNLPTRVRCTITGVGRSDIKVKRTRASGTIERQPDGRLVGQSDRDGEEPFLMARLGPGLYGSVQPFTDGKVTGVVGRRDQLFRDAHGRQDRGHVGDDQHTRCRRCKDELLDEAKLRHETDLCAGREREAVHR